MKRKLTNPDDDALCHAVHTDLLKWHLGNPRKNKLECDMYWYTEAGDVMRLGKELPTLTGVGLDMLILAERDGWFWEFRVGLHHVGRRIMNTVTVHGPDAKRGEFTYDRYKCGFVRALAIALLRAHGWTITISKEKNL